MITIFLLEYLKSFNFNIDMFNKIHFEAMLSVKQRVGLYEVEPQGQVRFSFRKSYEKNYFVKF